MSAPVDVLAVMDEAARDFAIYFPEADDARHEEMVQARAAVAELVGAATVICGTLHDDTDVSRILGTSSILPFRMLRAALARVGGAM